MAGVPYELLDCHDLTHGEVRVAARLWKLAQPQGDGEWFAWASTTFLAERTGQNRRSVTRQLGRLRELGWIVRASRQADGGESRSGWLMKIPADKDPHAPHEGRVRPTRGARTSQHGDTHVPQVGHQRPGPSLQTGTQVSQPGDPSVSHGGTQVSRERDTGAPQPLSTSDLSSELSTAIPPPSPPRGESTISSEHSGGDRARAGGGANDSGRTGESRQRGDPEQDRGSGTNGHSHGAESQLELGGAGAPRRRAAAKRVKRKRRKDPEAVDRARALWGRCDEYRRGRFTRARARGPTSRDAEVEEMLGAFERFRDEMGAEGDEEVWAALEASYQARVDEARLAADEGWRDGGPGTPGPERLEGWLTGRRSWSLERICVGHKIASRGGPTSRTGRFGFDRSKAHDDMHGGGGAKRI